MKSRAPAGIFVAHSRFAAVAAVGVAGASRLSSPVDLSPSMAAAGE